MKPLIINADDLGLSEGVNRAIYDCARAGNVLSATALANGPAFREGLDLLGTVPGMGIGIHLNLTGIWNVPGGDVPAGFFRGAPGFLLVACLSGRVNLDFAEQCLRKQFEAFLDTGATPTHYDGHHHVHTFPGISGLAARLAKEYAVRRARLPAESAGAVKTGAGARVKRVLISMLARTARSQLNQNAIAYPGGFFGFGLMGRPDFGERLHALLANVGRGTIEIMVHPGPREPDFTGDPYRHERFVETTTLIDPATTDRLSTLNLQPVSYEILN